MSGTGPSWTAAILATAVVGGAAWSFGRRSGLDEGAGLVVAPTEPTVTLLEDATCGPTEATSATVATHPTATAVPTLPKGLSDRARNGDLAALKELDAMPADARSVDDAVALFEGHAALARGDAATFASDLKQNPAILEDRTTATYAYRLLLDPSAAPTMLVALSQMPTTRAQDLLHDVASRGEAGSRLVILAKDLGAMPLGRKAQSPALKSLVALETATTCEARLAAFAKVETDADDRANDAIKALRVEVGCGPRSLDDCNPCLREADAKAAMDKAADAARARKYEAPWAVPR